MEKLTGKKPHRWIRRGVFFSHRDLVCEAFRLCAALGGLEALRGPATLPVHTCVPSRACVRVRAFVCAVLFRAAPRIARLCECVLVCIV